MWVRMADRMTLRCNSGFVGMGTPGLNPGLKSFAPLGQGADGADVFTMARLWDLDFDDGS